MRTLEETTIPITCADCGEEFMDDDLMDEVCLKDRVCLLCREIEGISAYLAPFIGGADPKVLAEHISTKLVERSIEI